MLGRIEPGPVVAIEGGGDTPKPYNDRLARLLVVPLLGVLAALLLVFFVFFSSYKVVGPSMEPNFLEGDLLLVTRGYDTPVKGDVVVVKSGNDRKTDDLLKRVVAVPGDTIYVSGDVAVVNGIQDGDANIIIGGIGGDIPKTTVPNGTVFVMGDNRPVSYDSRYFGVVPLESILGRAVFAYAPVHRVRRVRPLDK